MLPGTENIELERWSGALAQEYPAEYVPVYHGGDWKHWAGLVAGVPQFARLMIPHPEQFENWQAWVRVLRLVLEM